MPRANRDVTVLDGIPIERDWDVTGPIYPEDTFAVLGMLRQEGAEVDFEDPRGLHPLMNLPSTSGYVVPIIVFSKAGLFTRAADVLPAIVRARASMTRPRDAGLHCRIGFQDAEPDVEWFTFSSSASQSVGDSGAFTALERWLYEKKTLRA